MARQVIKPVIVTYHSRVNKNYIIERLDERLEGSLFIFAGCFDQSRAYGQDMFCRGDAKIFFI